MKTALVTGGNRGIGLAIVKGLAAQGLRVLLASREAKAGEKAVHGIYGDVRSVELDLSDARVTAEHFAKIQSAFPQIDALVNNAGILENGNLLEVAPEAFRRSMRVNMEAPLQLIQALAPSMVQRGYGRIVNISSGWGSFAEGLDGPAAYSVSKAALNAVTLVAAQSVPYGKVKINAMCPGWVRTRMGGEAAARSPEEGAATALWLATLPDDGPTGGFFRDQRMIGW